MCEKPKHRRKSSLVGLVVGALLGAVLGIILGNAFANVVCMPLEGPLSKGVGQLAIFASMMVGCILGALLGRRLKLFCW
jgi:hypothetical protein